MQDADFNARVRRIEGLVRNVEALPDAAAAAAALDLVRAVMEIHAAGLERVLELTGPAGAAALQKDSVVSSLLLLHGLHPAPFDERVAQALEKLEPYLRRRGASARLLSLERGSVRIQVEGGPPGSSDALREAVEEAIYSLAPEAAEVLVDCPAAPLAGFVPLSSLVAG